MNTCKVDLFIYAVQYLYVHSSAREQPADLAYYSLLDKAKSHETDMAEYDLNNESRQDSMAFQITVSSSINADHYRNSIEDLLPGPTVDTASPTLSPATALPLVHSVANVAATTNGSK